MATLALVPSQTETPAPSPCQIIAGLMLSSGITPDRLEGAYFDLNPRAS